MTLNRPLLQRALQFVEASEQARLQAPTSQPLWDQDDWARLRRRHFTAKEVEALSKQDLFETCGTAYCVAGFVTTTLPGYSAEIVLQPDRSWGGETGDVSAVLREFFDGEPIIDLDDDHPRSHFQLAAEALGLNHAQAAALFEGGNSAQDVRDFIIDFLAEEDALEQREVTS